MSRWPDDVVVWLSPPWPGGPGRVVWSSADWIRTVVEADWLWRHGLDTVDIAAALGIHERDALRAVSQAREARRTRGDAA